MEKTVYALGFFDGVHLGHQALLREAVRLAAEAGAAPGVVTFSTHPDGLVSGNAPKLLNTREERNGLLRAAGIESVFELPFDEKVKNTHWASFLRQLVEMDAAGFVCGDDFRFGAGGLGTPKKLEAFCKKQGIPYAIVPQQTLDGVRVSSTHIRHLLENGEMEQACRFLGHPHILTGEVVEGRQLGRTIGIPTANLAIPQGVAEPRHGVYACKAKTPEGEFLAVTNVGSRPTVEGHHVTVEPWLLDYSGDLYGKTVTLEFHAFLRPEQKFDSLEALKQEIQKNAAQTRDFFSKN